MKQNKHPQSKAKIAAHIKSCSTNDCGSNRNACNNCNSCGTCNKCSNCSNCCNCDCNCCSCCNPCLTNYYISTIACYLFECLSTNDLALLATTLTTLGDMITGMLTQQEICCPEEESCEDSSYDTSEDSCEESSEDSSKDTCETSCEDSSKDTF